MPFWLKKACWLSYWSSMALLSFLCSSVAIDERTISPFFRPEWTRLPEEIRLRLIDFFYPCSCCTECLGEILPSLRSLFNSGLLDRGEMKNELGLCYCCSSRSVLFSRDGVNPCRDGSTRKALKSSAVFCMAPMEAFLLIAAS